MGWTAIRPLIKECIYRLILPVTLLMLLMTRSSTKHDHIFAPEPDTHHYHR